MRKLTALFLMMFMVLGTVGVVYAVYDPEPFNSALSTMQSEGKMSSDLIHHAIIDLSSIETTGTVTATVYQSVYETMTVNTYTGLTPQTPIACSDKLTRFMFELSNQYRPETSCVISCLVDGRLVNGYTFGQLKDQSMYAFVSGIPDCLNNPPYSSGSSDNGSSSSSTWIDKYSPEQMSTKTIASFKISEQLYMVNGESKTMDVTPYIKDERTYIPVRYLAYSLGVPESGVKWNSESQQVTLTKDKITTSMVIGLPTMYADNQPIIMDVAPEIKDNRTMLPARWVAEALGAIVEWDDKTKQTTIKIAKPGN